MALTAEEKHKVVRLLGWSGKTLMPESTDYNNRVATSLDFLNEIIEAEVRVYIARLELLDETREAAMARALVKRIGDIELNDQELVILKTERKRLLRELSDLLGIPNVAKCGGMVRVSY